MSYEKISKYMSMILRHRPEVIGIRLDEHGWADVDELIEGIAKKKKFNREILEEIVRTDEKQRYSFNDDKTKIRANQGHSITVDLELEPAEPPEILWHGTAEKYVASIEKTGLRPGTRMYVHLSLDMQTAVKVGSRHGKPVIYQVKSGEMYRKGFRFYRSVNGVWLTIMVPVEYLIRVGSE
ncbi:MAG TPA: RNA 2'-phosphotransferase [Candidatus Mediterraneibacter excrementigallinarum]|nr:RNA 2'-phosphotransferase [Candidatus Mediterraneibacter excrementigallinarum]